MKVRFLYFVVVLFLLWDTGFTFVQFYNTPLDGDMASGIIPAEDVQQILDDPFGFNVLTSGIGHPNPNRYFVHWIFKKYFTEVPVFLQHFVSPVNSVYLSCAIFKIFCHSLFLTLMVLLANTFSPLSKKQVLISLLLVVPFLQSYGFNNQMGLIDKSITYTFFYGFPLAMFLVLIYVQKLIIKNEGLNFKRVVLYVFAGSLSIVLPLSGPLIAPVILISFLVWSFLEVKQEKSFNYFISSSFLEKYWPFLLAFLLSVYSVYLGTFNTTYLTDSIPLIERYERLPLGIFRQFTNKICFPLLIVGVLINYLLLRKNAQHRQLQNLITGFLLFTVLYIALLPLGGYRPYRPEILRFDTIMPVTVGLVFLYLFSTLEMLKIKQFFHWIHLFYALVFIVFTNADRAKFQDNDCERMVLENAAQSLQPSPDLLEAECKVISWEIKTTTEQRNQTLLLLRLWGVIE